MDYPGVDIPSNVAWRKTTLYSICGWFTSANFGDAATAFGGFFRLDEEDRTIEGCIVDTWGCAVIEGRLENSQLVFNKRYVQFANIATTSDMIEYQYDSTEEGWSGSYSFNEGFSTGQTFCKIAPAVEDAFAMIVGLPRR